MRSMFSYIKHTNFFKIFFKSMFKYVTLSMFHTKSMKLNLNVFGFALQKKFFNLYLFKTIFNEKKFLSKITSVK